MFSSNRLLAKFHLSFCQLWLPVTVEKEGEEWQATYLMLLSGS